MAFNNYLEDENDKPYFTTNSLAYYYDKMEGFAEKVEGSAKALNLTKEEVEKRLTLYIEQNKNELDQRLADWDGKLETFDSSVETLLSEWVDDGTLTHVIDSTLIDQKIAPVTAQLAETLKKGEASVLDIDKNKGKFDQTYMTDELLQQMAGDTPINAVPAKKSVTIEKLAFSKEGSNKYNPAESVDGVYINNVTGAEVASETFRASGFILGKLSTKYIIKWLRHIAFYDENKNFVSGINVESALRSNYVFELPSNAKMYRFSWTKTDPNAVEQQVNEGTALLPYEAYSQLIDKKYLEKQEVTIDELPNFPLEKMNFSEASSNLFDKNSITQNTYVNSSNGSLLTSTGWVSSDFIPVDELTRYIIKHLRHYAVYNVNKERIQGESSTGQMSLETIKGSKFIRFSWHLANDQPVVTLNTQQMNKGTQLLAYKPFGHKIASDAVEIKQDDFLLFLPAEICVAVGRTIELYNKQVAWCGNINNYHFKWDSQIGNAMKRKFSIKGETSIVGNHTLTLTVFDNNMKPVAQATTTVKVISNVVASTVKLLSIGDSLTNAKPWLAELSLLSGGKIENVGTRGGTHKHEGRSGFFAKQYLAPTEYTFENEGVHPFWDGSRFNWNHYKTNTGINPDAIQIFLGTNGIALDPTENANSIKQMVDYIRQDDSSIPIYVAFTLYRGNQDGLGVQTSNDGFAKNKGAWKLEEDRKIYNLMVRLYELLKDYSNLRFVPISLCHDSEYNFGTVEAPINPRANQTELLPTEATHPQAQGYLQMADTMFSVIVA